MPSINGEKKLKSCSKAIYDWTTGGYKCRTKDDLGRPGGVWEEDCEKCAAYDLKSESLEQILKSIKYHIAFYVGPKEIYDIDDILCVLDKLDRRDYSRRKFINKKNRMFGFELCGNGEIPGCVEYRRGWPELTPCPCKSEIDGKDVCNKEMRFKLYSENWNKAWQGETPDGLSTMDGQ